MSDLLFATPWWLFAGLVLVGGIFAWTGNNRQNKPTRNAGLALILIAIALKAVSFFIVTDKEKVSHLTDQLVKSVQDRDWKTFESLLDPDVRLGTASGTLFPNRDSLVKAAKADTESYNLTNVSGHITDIQQDAIGIVVDLEVGSEQSASFGYRVPSSWKLSWDQTGKDWHLHEVTCVRIGNEKSDQIDHLLGK